MKKILKSKQKGVHYSNHKSTYEEIITLVAIDVSHANINLLITEKFFKSMINNGSLFTSKLFRPPYPRYNPAAIMRHHSYAWAWQTIINENVLLNVHSCARTNINYLHRLGINQNLSHC